MRAIFCVTVLLFGIPAFAQHRGGPMIGAARPVPSLGTRGSVTPSGGVGRGNRPSFPGRWTSGSRLDGYGRRFGYGATYAWPYYGGWDYNPVLPSAYEEEFAGPDAPILLPAPGTPVAGPPAVASPVLHEYHFVEQPRMARRDKTTFTIVLKDQSTRSAVACWIAGGKLHYLDSRAQQHVLPPEVIDRDGTEKVNEANGLSIALPPG